MAEVAPGGVEGLVRLLAILATAVVAFLAVFLVVFVFVVNGLQLLRRFVLRPSEPDGWPQK